MFANQMAVQSDHADLGWIEAEVGRKIALRAHRMETALAGFAGPTVAADFASLNEDWERELARLYNGLGLDLTPASRTAMRKEHRRAARSPHRHHAARLA